VTGNRRSLLAMALIAAAIGIDRRSVPDVVNNMSRG
jgi:hypothetical protein